MRGKHPVSDGVTASTDVPRRDAHECSRLCHGDVALEHDARSSDTGVEVLIRVHVNADAGAKHSDHALRPVAHNPQAQLVALLICRPRSFTAGDLDRMLRAARARKVHDWLISYVVKKSPHVEPLRLAWLDDPDPVVASAGWALTADAVAKHPELLDLPALLDTVEAEMKSAPDRLQWEMNSTLAAIGIHHPDLRARALDIGERLEVLKDYPTPPNCTSPFAPIWIGEIVRRQSVR